MLVKGNKIYRNLQEQVGENQKNIEELQSLIGVGINVKYVVDTIADLSDIEDPEEGSFAAVGMAKPYTLFLFKGNVWIDFGLFPSPGPQGTPGTNGTNGINGQDAGFGSITTTTTTTSPENPAAVSVETSGPDTAKNIQFNFTIPKGDKGERGPRGYKGEKGDTGPQGPEAKIYMHRILFDFDGTDDIQLVLILTDNTEINSIELVTSLLWPKFKFERMVCTYYNDSDDYTLPAAFTLYGSAANISINLNFYTDSSMTLSYDVTNYSGELEISDYVTEL